MVVATRTDPSGIYPWRIHDDVDQLRACSGTNIFPLPDGREPGRRWVIGSAEDAWLRIEEPNAFVSRAHAELVRTAIGWELIDLGSKSGIAFDGEKLAKFAITPGAEVGIGRVNLVAESPLLRELHEMACRLIGWGPERRADVDAALRNIRWATARRQPLVLCADAGHVSIARLLHRCAIGVGRPFVQCERRSATGVARGDRAEVFGEGLPALAAAAGGTLVVRRSRLPADFERVLAAVRDGVRVMLVVCAPPPRGAPIHPQIIIPPLSSRTSELDRIINAYAADAPELGGSVTAEERAWVIRQPKLTFTTIETGTLRALAYRAGGGINKAAELADVDHASMSEWLARRQDLPTYQVEEDDDE